MRHKYTNMRYFDLLLNGCDCNIFGWPAVDYLLWKLLPQLPKNRMMLTIEKACLQILGACKF